VTRYEGRENLPMPQSQFCVSRLCKWDCGWYKDFLVSRKRLTMRNYWSVVVEAAGVEPASEGIPLKYLHAYPKFSVSPARTPQGWMPCRLAH
jgi:hypothetical protein